MLVIRPKGWNNMKWVAEIAEGREVFYDISGSSIQNKFNNQLPKTAFWFLTDIFSRSAISYYFLQAWCFVSDFPSRSELCKTHRFRGTMQTLI